MLIGSIISLNFFFDRYKEKQYSKDETTGI
jgi:hypothetical protein